MPHFSRAQLQRALAFWLLTTTLAALTTLMVYSAVQQDLRQSANDPQLAMAVDGAARLDGGATPSSVATTPRVEMSTSLSPFVIVLDNSGNVVASGATLDEATPAPPQGLVDSARQLGRDSVTWQPRDGVRSAAVLVPWKGGAVLAARSLSAVEDRIHNLLLLLAAGGVLVAGALAVVCLIATRLWPAASPSAP